MPEIIVDEIFLLINRWYRIENFDGFQNTFTNNLLGLINKANHTNTISLFHNKAFIPKVQIKKPYFNQV